MSANKRGLGKGLNELLAATLGASIVEAEHGNDSDVIEEIEESEQSDDGGTRIDPRMKAEGFARLPIEEITGGPFQPRQHIQPEGLEQLAESIKAQGVLQPIVVRERHQSGHLKYEIVAGERRWRAAQLAGLGEIPALIREMSDDAALAVALIENIQREGLSPIEEAVALKRLADDLELTHLQVAEAIGKSRASVTNAIRLLTLNNDVQKLLEIGQIEMGHARALLSLRGQIQSQVARTVAARGLSVRETERLVAKINEEKQPASSGAAAKVDPNIRKLETDLADKLGTPVLIRHGRKGHGTVVIKYNDVDELEGILSHIK
jgi:ParB family chromosome partitioning protein